MCEEFKSALKKYLCDAEIYTGDDSRVWDIIELPVYGRCLVANRDIQVNELIFYDKHLIAGPRSNNYDKIFCVSCYKILDKLTLCSKKCKFPVCHECEESDEHRIECDLIRSWKLKNETKYSKHLFRALTVIRGLLLSSDDTKLMFMMACHENTKVQNMEVDKILDEFDGLTEESEVVKELKRISSILNTNAFELGVAHDSTLSLRGLFPLAALMNHNCVPNIRYSYDKNKLMTVYASKLIRKGEQIFNSYTKFLWGTNQRRIHLGYSKNFLCKCDRCIDRTEFGSFISAIKCIHPDCDSIMLPVNPLSVTSPWHCEKCNMKLDHARVSRITDILSKQIFKRILNEPMNLIHQYLKEKLSTFLPASNQFTIELKLQIILKLKQEPNYVMTLEDHLDVERYCYDILEIIDKLAIGECFAKGYLYHKLVNAKIKLAELRGESLSAEMRKNMSELLEKCWVILGNTISEPSDLKELVEEFKQ